MKKLLCAFLMILVSGFANANIHIDGKVATTIIKEHIDETHKLAASREYNAQLNATGNNTMSGAGLYKVCIAAGWDIEKPEGKDKCDKFVQALVKQSDYKYYEACKNEYKGKPDYICIDDVFYALVNGIDVQIGQAIELCKEYALVKYNDDIECSEHTRPGTTNPNNDYVKCTSKLKPIYYEFKFDDTKQSTNTPIYKDTIRAVGNIHKVPFRDSGCSLERIMNDTACTVGYKTTDTAVCDKLSKSLDRFGMKAEVRNVTGASLNNVERFCAVSFTTNKCTAAKEYGIDDTAFKEVQYPLSPTLENYVKDYVFEQLKAKNIYPKSFSCDKMPVRGDQVVAGLHVANGYTLNCHIDDKCINFVFEDLSESANYSKNAALSRLACIKQGGKADGENCRGLDEAQCTALGEKIKASGKFMGTHYDRVRGGCILNGAVAESQINLFGEIAAGVALTLVTDGAATIPVVVSIGTDLAFDAINDWQRKIPYNDYQEFIQHVLACSEDSKGALKDAIRISKINSVENKYCLSETIRTDYQLVVGQMDKLAPEDQRILADVFSNIVENIGDSEYIRKASESDISLVKKSRNFAQGTLLAGIILVHPEKMLSKFDDVARDVARLRYGASKNFTQHLDDFRTLGKNTALPMARLSKSEWQILNKSLAIDGIELVEKDGYMIFRKISSIENSGIRNFLTRFKYNLDTRVSTYQDVLKKWNLPADATDDVIEAHYKTLKAEVDLIPDNGMSEVNELKASILSDYDTIKRTKPGYLKGANRFVEEANAVAADLEKLGYKVNSFEHTGLKKFSVSNEDIERMLLDDGNFAAIKNKLLSIEEKIKSLQIEAAPDFAKMFEEDAIVARGQINMLESFVDDYPRMFMSARRSENIGDNLRHFNIDVEEMGLAVADRQYTYLLDEFISRYRSRVNDAEDALLQIQKQDLLADDLGRYLRSEIETAQENIRLFDRLDDMLKEHNYIGHVGYYGPDPNSTNLYEQLQYWARKFNVEADLDHMTAYEYQRLSGVIKSNIEEAKSFVGSLNGKEGDVFSELFRKINQEAERAENVLRKTDNIVFYGDHPNDLGYDPSLRSLFDGVAFPNY